MVITAVTNWKGGSGKTTTAVNTAAGFAIRGKNVLFIDTDPSGDGSEHLLPEDTPVKETVASLYRGGKLADATYQSTVKGLDIVPADMSLASLDLEVGNDPNRNTLLKKAINNKTTADYDYVIIDMPPSFGIHLFNPLAVAERLIIPVNEYLAMKKFVKYQYVIESFAKDYNPKLEIDSIVMTMVAGNATMFKEIREAMVDLFGDKVCKTSIPRSVKFAESPSYNKCIYHYVPGSHAAIQHLKLVDELLAKWEGAV
jgi:chromosome partitioning protein